MWLPKPVYAALPYYYCALGAVALVVRPYLDWGYWPAICLGLGALGIGAGAAVWWKRRSSAK